MFRPRTSKTAAGPKTALPVTAYPTTSAGPVIPTNFAQIPEGRYTETIYTLIRDRKFKHVIKLISSHVLIDHLETCSRGGLSLLGFCYYMTEDYVNATKCYRVLSNKYSSEEYQLYLAQSLFKSGQYEEAEKVLNKIEAKDYKEQIHRLHACITFLMNDLAACSHLLKQMPEKSVETLIDNASLLYKEGKLQEALEKYQEAFKIKGVDAQLCYCIALCHYQLKDYTLALKFIADIIEKALAEYPELNVGLATEAVDVRSVGNSQHLQDSFLVEAFNLKAAIEFQLKNIDNAKEALTDMPPRNEDELDPITLHNLALVNSDKKPQDSFEKLNFLVQSFNCPPETLNNLLLLHIKYGNYDLAADTLAQNRQLADMTISSSTLEFLDAVLLKGVSPDDAFKQLDDVGNSFIDRLRQIAKQVKNQDPSVKKLVREYDDTIEGYIPILMQQAKIYWDLKQYDMVEKLFRKSVEFCNEHDIWRLNVAHTLFMQEKYKEAISFYEPIVKKNFSNLLAVQAIVLANLCVSYIMTSQNEQAEEIMRIIEKEEENDQKSVYHLCIVNLVIGTLYCSKGNYEFGISRVVKSMQPFEKKLGTDTWFYAKKCLVSLFDGLSRHCVQLQDSSLKDVFQFLDDCDHFGQGAASHSDDSVTISMEARMIKSLFCELFD